jgi:acetyltransferase-like isoleucine patch superfamily enzyme
LGYYIPIWVYLLNIFNNFDGIGHPSTKGNVIIGNDVWIGGNVTIMSGITIGDRVVICK